MKINFKDKPCPQVGDLRTKTKFLYIPKIIDDELRWWEEATWKELYTWADTWDSDRKLKWCKHRWVDKR